MKIINRYLIALILAAAIINVFLAVLQQNDLSVYFVVNVIAYLIITLLHVYFNPKARRALNVVTIVLFAGFMVVVAIKVFEILYR